MFLNEINHCNISLPFWYCVLFGIVFASLSRADDDISIAIDAWLDDNDQVAIPLLSKLANAGDEEAMILLGQIARRPGEFSPFMHSLSKKERSSLIKASKGLFGESWLKRVDAKKELAGALLSIDDVPNRFAGALLLLELGERGQAIRSFRRFEVSGVIPEHYLNSIEAVDFPKELDAFKWYVATITGDPNRVLKEALADMADSPLSTYRYFGYISHLLTNKGQYEKDLKLARTLLNGDSYPRSGETWSEMNSFSDKAYEIYKTAPELKPIVNVCAKMCTSEVNACMRTGYNLLGGYAGIMDIQSPSETIISSEKYFESKRFSVDMLRRMNAEQIPFWINNRPSVVNKCIARKVYFSSPRTHRSFDKKHRSFLGIL